jgi:hypothetical protein
MKINKSLLLIFLLGILMSCGEDFTDDYNKLKKEYDQLSEQQKELNKKNEELSAANQKMVIQNQEGLVVNFISKQIKLIEDDKRLYESRFKNILKDGKLDKTIITEYVRDFDLTDNFQMPISTITYQHTYNDKGIIIKSESNQKLINWGWEDGNCVDIIITRYEPEHSSKREYITTYKINKQGSITSIKYTNLTYNFSYDSNNNLIKKEQINEGKLIRKEEYEYNSDQKLVKLNYFNEKGLFRTDAIKYESDRTIFTKDLKSKENNGSYKEFEYDLNYRIIKRTSKSGSYNYLSEVKYDNENKVSYYKYEAKDYNGSTLISGTTKEITNIIHNTRQTYLQLNYSNYIQFNTSELKSFKYKELQFEEGDADFSLKESYELVRKNEDKNFQTISKINFDKDENKIKELVNTEFFEEAPFAPKKREIKTFENNALISTVMQTNTINKSSYYQGWKTQN